MNPAALSAIANGDLDNFIAATTPGGIEAQESQGQRDMIASRRLPKEINGASRADLEAAWGIKFVADADDLFVNVTLPAGWSLRPSDHSMWSYLHDDQGRQRAAIFYKAAFYDRSASMRVQSRYFCDRSYGKNGAPDLYFVTDSATGLRAYEAGECASRDYSASDLLQQKCRDFLAQNYPEYANPLAYWD